MHLPDYFNGRKYSLHNIERLRCGTGYSKAKKVWQNVFIDEIRAFIRSVLSMEQFLQEKIEDLDRDMAHLQVVWKTPVNYRRNMLTLLAMELSENRFLSKRGCREIAIIHKILYIHTKLETISCMIAAFPDNPGNYVRVFFILFRNL